MIRDVVSGIYKGGYRIELEFDDGQRGIVDFAKYLKRRGVSEEASQKDKDLHTETPLTGG